LSILGNGRQINLDAKEGVQRGMDTMEKGVGSGKRKG